jgi:hypothetical protein
MLEHVRFQVLVTPSRDDGDQIMKALDLDARLTSYRVLMGLTSRRSLSSAAGFATNTRTKTGLHDHDMDPECIMFSISMLKNWPESPAESNLHCVGHFCENISKSFGNEGKEAQQHVAGDRR